MPLTYTGFGGRSMPGLGIVHGSDSITGALIRERTLVAPGSLPVPGANDPAHIVAGHCLIGFRSLQRAEATITRLEAMAYRRLQEDGVHAAWGFSSFPDFVREVLGVRPRTAKRRLALARLLDESPPLARAFEGGRVTACKVLALRPVLRDPSAPFWIELAETIPVRELRARIREAMETDGTDEDEEEPGETVTFSAPPAAALAWKQGMDTARRVLGWEAPPHLCLEAILSEAQVALETTPLPASSSLASALPASPSPTTHRGEGVSHASGKPVPPGRAEILGRDRDQRLEPPESVNRQGGSQESGSQEMSGSQDKGKPKSSARLAPEAIRSVRQTLALVSTELESLQQLTRGLNSPASDSRACVERLRTLRDIWRPLRLLRGRLLRELQTWGGLSELGYRNLRDFAEGELGLSERTARALISETFLFDDEPKLERAFREGRIGVGQAFLIRRVALSKTLDPFLRRAGEVTYLQLAREVRFIERLAEFFPRVWSRHPGPFPRPDIEPALLEGLWESGWNQATLTKELRSRGISTEAGPGVVSLGAVGVDPAEHPLQMRRLEVLLDLLVISRFEEPGPLGEVGLEPWTGDPGARQTLALGHGFTTVRFWLPQEIYGHWCRALDRIRARWGPLPTWAGAILLLEEAVREWTRVDPDRLPTEVAVLERDDYRCQAPGCTSRQGLESHHIVFASQGGTDKAPNRVSLCHIHHTLIHRVGSIRVRGAAPDHLVWELGETDSHADRPVYRGMKRVAG